MDATYKLCTPKEFEYTCEAILFDFIHLPTVKRLNVIEETRRKQLNNIESKRTTTMETTHVGFWTRWIFPFLECDEKGFHNFVYTTTRLLCFTCNEQTCSRDVLQINSSVKTSGNHSDTRGVIVIQYSRANNVR